MMPRGPKGEKRLADVIGNAVLVMKIATGDEPDTISKSDPAIVARARKGGLKGGDARAKKLSAAKRKTIARRAAKARWKSS
jgi:hypothetical protein